MALPHPLTEREHKKFEEDANGDVAVRVITVQDATTGATDVEGDVAHDAVDSGNPVKVGGYATDPTSMPTAVASADRVNGTFDLQGRQITYDGVLGAGEDLTNDVLKVEERFSYQPIVAADTQVKASAGFLHTVTVSCDDAAPTAGSIIIYDNTAESGTEVFNHTFTTTPFVPFTVTLDVSMGTGIYIGFTTTADVNVMLSYR